MSIMRSEIHALQKEYDWIIDDEVSSVFAEMSALVLEAIQLFPVSSFVSSSFSEANSSKENLSSKPKKYIMTHPNSNQYVKSVITLSGDCIVESEIEIKLNRGTPVPFRTSIYVDLPWKLQQIQDSKNHLLRACNLLSSLPRLQTGEQVVSVIDDISCFVQSSRDSLIHPRKKTLEELLCSEELRCLKPNLPNDTVISFYIKGQRLILSAYQFTLPTSVKPREIIGHCQSEYSVTWLNDVLVFCTLTLQLCQQLKNKLVIFQQFERDIVC